MSKTLRRILMAGAVSASCFAATLFWYHATTPKLNLQTEAGIQIAEILSFQHDVAKRPLKRLVWKTLGTGDALFNGEAIKTAAGSEARIRFLSTNSILEIEPNSLIVLEQNDDQISLDLLEGGLFVKSKKQGSEAPAITLKTEKGKVELSNAEASLSRKKGKSVNLQVLSGQAKVEIDGKRRTLKKGNSGRLDKQGLDVIKSSIEILSPKPLETVFINPENPKPISFKFKPTAKPWAITLHAGKSRAEMAPIEGVRARGNKGIIKAPLKVGRYYWKLVATENEKIVAESPTLRMPVMALMPPTPFSPIANQIIRTKTLPREVDFQWGGAEAYDQVQLLVAKTRKFTQPIFKQNFKEGLAQVELPSQGQFFWKLVGYKNKRQVTSRVQSLQVFKFATLKAPTLLTPMHLSEFYKPDLRDGSIALEWSPMKEATSYEIKISLTRPSGKLIEQTYKAKKNKIRIPKALRGDYTWSVTSLAGNDRRSVPSDSSSFALKGYPDITWLNRKKPDVYSYVTAKPTAELHWEKGPKLTQQYRLRLGRNKNEIKADKGRLINDTKILQEFPEPGKFKAMVEALDSSGAVIARSTIRTLFLKEKPLLLAPLIEPGSDGDLKANKKGDYKLTWSDVDGAKEYLLELKDLQSKRLKIYKYSDPQGDLKALLPGKYEVRVHAIDVSGRRGPASIMRNLSVPRKSSIKAPKIKTLEVND